jgi:hypothetical protein
LRMQGALGPLQSEAVVGTLTIAMEPMKDGAGTRLSFSYVVGGYMRYKVTDIGPAADKMLGDQFERLIKPLGKVVAETAKGDKAEEWSIDPDKLEVEKTAPDGAASKVGKPEKVEPDAAKGDE